MNTTDLVLNSERGHAAFQTKGHVMLPADAEAQQAQTSHRPCASQKTKESPKKISNTGSCSVSNCVERVACYTEKATTAKILCRTTTSSKFTQILYQTAINSHLVSKGLRFKWASSVSSRWWSIKGSRSSQTLSRAANKRRSSSTRKDISCQQQVPPKCTDYLF